MPLSPQEEQELAQLENKRMPSGNKKGLGFVGRTMLKIAPKNPAMAGTAQAMWNIMPQNPKNQLQNLPAVLGGLGAASPIPGGASIGTAIGQGLRYGGAKLFKQPVPGLGQHAFELGGSALGDLVAIPALKGRIYGKQIGEIEKAHGVLPAEDIPSLSRPAGPEKVSQMIDDNIITVKQAQQGGGTPEFWKQIKDQADWIYTRGKDLAVSSADRLKLRWLSKAAEEGLNKAVPGRAAPAELLARSQTIPRFLGNMAGQIPAKYKMAGAVGGAVGVPLGIAEVLKKLLGG